MAAASAKMRRCCEARAVIFQRKTPSSKKAMCSFSSLPQKKALCATRSAPAIPWRLKRAAQDGWERENCSSLLYETLVDTRSRELIHELTLRSERMKWPHIAAS